MKQRKEDGERERAEGGGTERRPLSDSRNLGAVNLAEDTPVYTGSRARTRALALAARRAFITRNSNNVK